MLGSLDAVGTGFVAKQNVPLPASVLWIVHPDGAVIVALAFRKYGTAHSRSPSARFAGLFTVSDADEFDDADAMFPVPVCAEGALIRPERRSPSRWGS